MAKLPVPLFINPRPSYLPFQALRVAHRAIVTLFIAINQLGPLLSIPGKSANPLDTSEEAVLQQINRLEQLVMVNSVESIRLLGLDGAPFIQADASGRLRMSSAGLQEKVKEWFVTNAVRNDKEVQEAVKTVVQTRESSLEGFDRSTAEN